MPRATNKTTRTHHSLNDFCFLLVMLFMVLFSNLYMLGILRLARHSLHETRKVKVTVSMFGQNHISMEMSIEKAHLVWDANQDDTSWLRCQPICDISMEMPIKKNTSRLRCRLKYQHVNSNLHFQYLTNIISYILSLMKWSSIAKWLKLWVAFGPTLL